MIRTPLFHVLAATALLSSSSCGYTLKQANNPLLATEKVKSIYLEPTVNDTFKTGVEVTVYNALQKEFLKGGRIQITRDRAKANAILATTVEAAQYSTQAVTPSNQLQPNELGDKNRSVATVYGASLGCRFTLRKNTKNPKARGRVLWTQSYARSMSFAANTQLGTLGTTSALINESEFERAIGDLAEQLMTDASDGLLSAF